MREVVLSRKLPIDETDKAWIDLNRIAKVRIEPLAKAKLARVEGVISVLSDSIDDKFFLRAPKLTVVANYAVGYNNIDLREATARGVLVCNTPNVLTNATAELTIALLFAAARRFKEATEMIRTRKFKGWDPYLLLGGELAGAQLLIIGPGRIGSQVALKARALGMKVVTHGRADSSNNLERLLATSDFVSLHCPLTSQTRGLVGARQFARMKKGVHLINTARGELVNETALLKALKSGRLAGAALDVFHNEPRLRPALRAHPRVFTIPHLGSATVEARRAMASLAIRGVVDVLSGRVPKNRVN